MLKRIDETTVIHEDCGTKIHPYGDGYGFCPRCDLDFRHDKIKATDIGDEGDLQ